MDVKRLVEEADIVTVAEYIGMPIKRKGSYLFTECANKEHEEYSQFQHAVLKSDHFHCFSCGAHYDMISMVMHWKEKNGEPISFVEACEIIAESCGIKIEKESKKDFKKFPLTEKEISLIGLGGYGNNIKTHENEDIKPMNLKILFKKDEIAFRYLISESAKEYANRYKGMADALSTESNDFSNNLRNECEKNYRQCLRIYAEYK